MTYLVVWNRRPVTVVQLAAFTREAAKIWSDAELDEFTDYIARNPEAGDIVRGTGGVRKIRWNAKGKGKRGGARVIYFFYNPNNPVYLVSIYAKNERETISEADRKLYGRMSEEIKGRLK
jgi:hypothetical protein